MLVSSRSYGDPLTPIAPALPLRSFSRIAARQICALQTLSCSPIPTCPALLAQALREIHAAKSVQTHGRSVDGRLARLDAGDGDRRPRSGARAERVRADGSAFGARLLSALPHDPPERRFQNAQDCALAVAHRAQPHSLRRAAWLVLSR